MARYLWNEKTRKLELIDPDGFRDPNKGLNGPVYCPDGGYFDKALNRRFETKAEKRAYMREHGLKSAGSDDKHHSGPEAGLGKTYYSVPGLKKAYSRGYKYRNK